MVPIEFMMLTLLVCFGVVGLAREFPKELGATIVFTGMLLFFDLAGSKVGSLSYAVLSRLGVKADQALVSWWVYSLVILLTVCIVYAGETLSYSGVWTPGPILGRVFDIFIGLFNGWLVVGTWWYFANQLNYPMSATGTYVPPLSPLAAQLVKWTPLAIIPQPNSYLYIIGFLLFLIVLKVIR
jgi:hypothetical protein